jgi:biopolymer transport protein ExbD
MSKRSLSLLAAVGLATGPVGAATASPTTADIREVGLASSCPVALVWVGKGTAVSTEVNRLSNGTCRYENIQVVERRELAQRLVQIPEGVIFVQAWDDTSYEDLMHALVTMQDAGHYNMILGNEPLPS